MKFPRIFEYLTHRSPNGPPDNGCSSCFDENQTPVWAYSVKDLSADVGRDPIVRAQARIEMPLGRNFLHPGQILSNIGLDLEIYGHRIRLEGIELSVIAATPLPDLSAPLTEST